MYAKCGSLASKGLPDLVFVPETAHALEPYPFLSVFNKFRKFSVSLAYCLNDFKRISFDEIVTKFGSYEGKISDKYSGPSCSLIAPKNNSESHPPCSSHAIIVLNATISSGSKVGSSSICNNLNSSGYSDGERLLT